MQPVKGMAILQLFQIECVATKIPQSAGWEPTPYIANFSPTAYGTNDSSLNISAKHSCIKSIVYKDGI